MLQETHSYKTVYLQELHPVWAGSSNIYKANTLLLQIELNASQFTRLGEH